MPNLHDSFDPEKTHERLAFQPADPEDTTGSPDTSGCTCPPGNTPYTLELDEGRPSLVHTACGKSPGDSWGDWADLVYMEPVPVTVEWVPDCNGAEWHGMDRCEDGSTLRVTPGVRGTGYGPAAEELAEYLADQRLSVLQGAFRILGMRLDVRVSEEATPDPAASPEYCGQEAPEILADAEGKEWHAGDCFCTLEPHGPEVDHQCVPCAGRTGMPSWKDPAAGE